MKEQIRAKRICKIYKDYINEQDSILDVGCGDGMIATLIKKILNKNIYLVGTDMIDMDCPFRFKLTDGKTLPFKDKSFDIAMVNDVLHHIPFEKQIIIIKECLRVAKKVLLYEVKDGFLEKMVDIVTNQIYDRRVKLPLTMRKVEDWMKLFQKMNIKYVVRIIPRSLDQLYLLKNYLFVLEK